MTENKGSWYTFDDDSLNEKQRKYVALLENIFYMKNPRGQKVPYKMTPYQKEYHSESLNILEEKAKNIIWNKARGVSFTMSTLVELIMTGASYEDQEIPIISHRQKASYKMLNNAKWLIEKCDLEEIREETYYTSKSSFIEFTRTGSVIRVYPSSVAADAVRSTRLIRGMIDEFAFQRNGHTLWRAAKDTMRGEIGQWIIGSTPNGRQNKFFSLVDKSRKKDIGFKLFELPVFDPERFDPDKSVHEQDVSPIAPWINIDKLETSRREDKEGFLQENMCDFLDESTSLIQYQKILKVVRKKLHNYREEFRDDPDFLYETNNPMLFGVDVAQSNDFFATSGFEMMETSSGDVYAVQRFLDYFTNIDPTEMEQYLLKILKRFPSIVDMKIDSTGMGTFLPNYLQRKHRDKVTGVNFASKMKTEQNKFKIRTRDAMSYNLQKMVNNKKVFLLDDQTQINHLNSVNRELKVISGGENNEGHGDIFFADALALLRNSSTLRKHQRSAYQKYTPSKKKRRGVERFLDERYSNLKKV